MLSLHTFVGSQRSGPKNVTAQNENVTRIFEHRFFKIISLSMPWTVSGSYHILQERVLYGHFNLR